MKITQHTTLHEFMQYVDLFEVSPDQITKMMPRIEKHRKPETLCGRGVPANLNDLTYEELYRLNSVKGVDDVLTVYLDVVLGLTIEQVIYESAFDVFAFVAFVNRERIRIGKLFAGIKTKHTQEEIQAGVEKLNHGYFGTIDWYARRMGLHDHSEAEKVKWIRIYRCLKIDAENAAYERRLRDIMMKKK